MSYSYYQARSTAHNNTPYSQNDPISSQSSNEKPFNIESSSKSHDQFNKKQSLRWQSSSMKNWEHKKFDRQLHVDQNGSNDLGICGWILAGFAVVIVFLTMPLSLFFCIKVVQEYERAVIFRLGRLLPGGPKGPGLFIVIPCIDSYKKVDLRVVSFDVPPQEILTKDSVTVAVDAVVYSRISNSTISVTNVEDATRSTKLLAQTTLRNILGTKTLAEILSDRDTISLQMQNMLDEATDPWGVKVERVEVKDVRLPVQLQRAMAAEAEATREARAKVIAAEGEEKASRALSQAASVISQSSAALQLRYLQTLNSISAEKNSTIIFPFPIELFRTFIPKNKNKKELSTSSVLPQKTEKSYMSMNTQTSYQSSSEDTNKNCVIREESILRL
ncbi:Band 7 protein family and Stomatin family-containing protein [Strongyloides ratti]|uniref:Band 7 protein family and Stomatin family-containing protein n=1 Tax=Strongyloides ratti TaxID=34506 RepID=A0A090MZS3_STRRB|nr:Band 7 protein family and Stomatin family-containing protein [Strongyloides ratti]CEF69434.1 Band 7 protein family and Stomatin family-containing protein [Strongyloides ratti]